MKPFAAFLHTLAALGLLYFPGQLYANTDTAPNGSKAFLLEQNFSSAFTLCAVANVGLEDAPHSAIPLVLTRTYKRLPVPQFSNETVSDVLLKHKGTFQQQIQPNKTSICINIHYTYAKIAFELLDFILNKAAISDELINSVKKEVFTELKDKDLVYTGKARKTVEHLFSRNWFSPSPQTSDEIENTFPALTRIFQSQLSNSKIMLFGIGNLRAAEFKNNLHKYFSSTLPKKNIPSQNQSKITLLKTSHDVFINKCNKNEAPFIQIDFAVQQPKSDPLTQMVLNRIMSFSPSSLLDRTLLNDSKLATEATFSAVTSRDGFQYGNLFIQLAKEDFIPVLSKTLSILNPIKRGEIPDDAIANAINTRSTEYRFMLADIKPTNGYQESLSTLTKTLAIIPDDFMNYSDALTKVSKPSLSQMAKNLLSSEHYMVSMCYSDKFTGKLDKQIIQNILSASGSEQKQTKQLSRFENGMTIITQKFDRAPIESLVLLSRTGGVIDDPFAGYSRVLKAYLKRRNKNYDAQSMQKLLSEKNVQIKTKEDPLGTQLSFLFLPESLDFVLSLAKTMLQNPEFNPPDLETVKNEHKSMLSYINSNSDQMGRIALYSKMLGWSNGGFGTESEINHINSSNLKRYFKRVFQPRNIIVSYAGSVSHDSIKTYFSSFSDKLTNDKTFFTQSLTLPQSSPEIATFDVQMPSDKLDYMGFIGQVPATPEEIPLVDLLLQYYYTKIKSSPLKDDLQNFSGFSLGNKYYFFLISKCQSSKCEDNLKSFTDILFQIGKSPPSSEELKSTRDFFYNTKEDETRHPPSAAEDNAVSELIFANINHSAESLPTILRATPKELADLATKRLNPNQLSRIIIRAKTAEDKK